MASSSSDEAVSQRRSSSGANVALRDALIDLMRRAGTELNSSEAEVLVKALSSEMRLSEKPASASSSDERVRSDGKNAQIHRRESISGRVESESSVTPSVAVESTMVIGVSHPVSRSGHGEVAKDGSEAQDSGKDEPDGHGQGTERAGDSVSPLPQGAEAVYGDADDGYQSTSGSAVTNDRNATQPWTGDNEWLANHHEAAAIFEEHPELVDFVTALMSRQDELETALSQTEHELKRREQEHLNHVQYLEDLSLAQIEQANLRAKQVTEVARKGAALLSPEKAFQKLVHELNEKEKQLKMLKMQQDKLKVEMKERDYQHSQAHKSYAEEQQQLLQELTGMRRTLHDIRQRSMRRKKSTKANRSASLLAEEFARLAADKNDEALALQAELEAIERNKSDYSDLTQSGGVYRVDSGTRSVSRTSSVLDKYVESNGPASEQDTIVFHPNPVATSTPHADGFLDFDVYVNEDEGDIIAKLTGASAMKTKSLDDLLTETEPTAMEDSKMNDRGVSPSDTLSAGSADSTEWIYHASAFGPRNETDVSTASQGGQLRRSGSADQLTAMSPSKKTGTSCMELSRNDDQPRARSKTISSPRSPLNTYDPLRDERPASQGAVTSDMLSMTPSTKQSSRSEAAMPFIKTRTVHSRRKMQFERTLDGEKMEPDEDSEAEKMAKRAAEFDAAMEGVTRNRSDTDKRKIKRWMTLPPNLGRLASAKLEWRKAGESAPPTGNIGSVYRTPAKPEDSSNSRDSPVPQVGDPASNTGTPMRIFNVAILGDSGVGKTTFIQRFANQGRRHNSGIPKATIGVDYVVKNAVIANQTVTLKLWDTAGTERFYSLAQNYLRRCDGVLLMFDITKRSTFEGIRRWQAGVTQTCREGATLMVIGNKVDLVEDGLATQTVTANEGVVLAHTMNNGMYMESSGRRGLGVDEACSILTKAMLAKEDEELQGLPQPQFIDNSTTTPATREYRCCRGQ